MESKTRGTEGETIAIKYLKENGYQILRRNYTKRFGELDIIALKDGLIVFVEVKSRSSVQYGFPFEAVDHRKISRIRKTAVAFLQEEPEWLRYQPRFDVIEVYFSLDNRINHIENAF